MTAKSPGAETILTQAVEIPDPAERGAFLDRACGADAGLRSRLGRMADDHFRAGSFLEHPAAVIPDETVAIESGDSESAVGSRVGPYVLRELLGEGGMGAVYVAEQSEPVRRKVALKVIKPGMDSRQVVARFEAERQALALMDHPNIARILDGGTTEEGRPFFVMELVLGVPITEYCDRAALTTRQRLELFVPVCQAVQHAHQKGVIHRDLKPGNILVTLYDGKPVPKVIDFGIAKAIGSRLTEQTVYTRFAQMVGTPLYMSPEQAELSAVDVDTRSDVYSLGVLLFELLTGTTPFDAERLRNAGFDEIRRIIREDEPPRPSQRLSTLAAKARSTVSERRGIDGRRLAGVLRGELDWVVMKCLEKDRDRRYESASALAADVQRYLNDEPVEACPPSAGYRLRKFWRRNRGALAAAAVLVLVIVPTLAVSTLLFWDQKLQAEEAQKVAEAQKRHVEEAYREEVRHRKRARQVVDTMYTDVAEKLLPQEPGLGGIRKEFLLKALAFYEEEAAEQKDDRETRVQTVWACTRAGRIHWTNNDNATAIKLYDRAVALADRLVADAPTDPDLRALQAHALFGRSWILNELMRHPEAKDDRQQALYLYSGLAAKYPRVAHYRRHEAHVCGRLGLLSSVDEAETLYRQALMLAERFSVDFPAEDARAEIAFACYDLGGYLADKSDYDRVGEKREKLRNEAERLLTRAVPIWRSLTVGTSFYPENLYHLGHTLTRLAALRERHSMGDRDPLATAYFNEAKAVFLRLDRDLSGHMFNTQDYLVRVLSSCRREPEAVMYSVEARLFPENDWRLHSSLDGRVFKGGECDELVAYLREVIRTRSDNPALHVLLGHCLLTADKRDEATASFREAIRLKPDYAEAHYYLGLVLLKLERFEESLSELRRGHELGRKQKEWNYPSRRWVKEAERMTAGIKKPAKIAADEVKLPGLREMLAPAELELRVMLFSASLERYGAACDAVLAGCGQGVDAAKLDNETRRTLRQRGHRWLREDLSWWLALAHQPNNHPVIHQVMDLWQADTDLALVRNEAELKKLPEAEQIEWRKLWAKVAELKARVGNPPLAPPPRAVEAKRP